MKNNSFISNGNTTINNAFTGCTSLPKVAMPEGVTAIGNNAFTGCNSLPEVAMPEGVTTDIESEDEYGEYLVEVLRAVPAEDLLGAYHLGGMYAVEDLLSVAGFDADSVEEYDDLLEEVARYLGNPYLDPEEVVVIRALAGNYDDIEDEDEVED